jgi:hypothetical protein
VRTCTGGFPCTLSAADKTSAQNLAMTGTPTGTIKHFPWNLTSTPAPVITFTVGSNFNSGGLYRQNGEVVQAAGSVPMTLTLLGYLAVPVAYTLVVTDQARHNDIGD